MKKNNKFFRLFRLFQPWEIVLIVLISLFILGGIISAIIPNITASAEQNIVVENAQEQEEKEAIPNTKWVRFLFDNSELYICTTHGGEVFEIQKDSDGWVSRTSAQREAFSYLYHPTPIFRNGCFEYIGELPLEAQKEILQIIYLRDLLS